MSGEREGRWWLGSTKGGKTVHQAGCQHARVPYVWANQHITLDALADDLSASGAWRWHRFCQRCCGALDDAVKARALHPQGARSATRREGFA